jgi:hypothetical protein
MFVFKFCNSYYLKRDYVFCVWYGHRVHSKLLMCEIFQRERRWLWGVTKISRLNYKNAFLLIFRYRYEHHKMRITNILLRYVNLLNIIVLWSRGAQIQGPGSTRWLNCVAVVAQYLLILQCGTCFMSHRVWKLL